MLQTVMNDSFFNCKNVIYLISVMDKKTQFISVTKTEWYSELLPQTDHPTNATYRISLLELKKKHNLYIFEVIFKAYLLKTQDPDNYNKWGPHKMLLAKNCIFRKC